MKLEHIGLHCRDDRVEKIVIRIDGHRHRERSAPRQLPQATGRFRIDVARAFREEDEADMRRSAGQRGSDGFLCLQAADLDVHVLASEQ